MNRNDIVNFIKENTDSQNKENNRKILDYFLSLEEKDRNVFLDIMINLRENAAIRDEDEPYFFDIKNFIVSLEDNNIEYDARRLLNYIKEPHDDYPLINEDIIIYLYEKHPEIYKEILLQNNDDKTDLLLILHINQKKIDLEDKININNGLVNNKVIEYLIQHDRLNKEEFNLFINDYVSKTMTKSLGWGKLNINTREYFMSNDIFKDIVFTYVNDNIKSLKNFMDLDFLNYYSKRVGGNDEQNALFLKELLDRILSENNDNKMFFIDKFIIPNKDKINSRKNYEDLYSFLYKDREVFEYLYSSIDMLQKKPLFFANIVKSILNEELGDKEKLSLIKDYMKHPLYQKQQNEIYLYNYEGVKKKEYLNTSVSEVFNFIFNNISTFPKEYNDKMKNRLSLSLKVLKLLLKKEKLDLKTNGVFKTLNNFTFTAKDNPIFNKLNKKNSILFIKLLNFIENNVDLKSIYIDVNFLKIKNSFLKSFTHANDNNTNEILNYLEIAGSNTFEKNIYYLQSFSYFNTLKVDTLENIFMKKIIETIENTDISILGNIRKSLDNKDYRINEQTKRTFLPILENIILKESINITTEKNNHKKRL